LSAYQKATVTVDPEVSKKKTISGWVNSKLLARAHCPKDMN